MRSLSVSTGRVGTVGLNHPGCLAGREDGGGVVEVTVLWECQQRGSLSDPAISAWLKVQQQLGGK